MAWNEPGKGNGNKKDPWGNGSGQQPPDLDEIFKNLQKKFRSFFGGSKGNSGGTGGQDDKGATIGLSIISVILVVLYGIAGFYIVKPAEEAAVFQFGRYVETVGPGPHWIPRFISSKQIVNVQEVSTSQHEAQMLTKDENIVSVELGVQYRVDNAPDFLFNVANPRQTLEQVTDSAVRQVIGHSTLDEILTSGREKIRYQIKSEIVRILSGYEVGIEILDVAMQPAKAPDAVKEAFDDAIKAQEDEVRSINRARAYEKQKVPIAEGAAQRRISDAEAYKQNVILQAQGDAAKFDKLLPEYAKAPKVTKERLYLETMQSVLTNTSKIFVDSSGSNNLVYLPLDKIWQKNATSRPFDPIKGKDLVSDASDTVNKALGSNLASSGRWSHDSRSRDNYSR